MKPIITIILSFVSLIGFGQAYSTSFKDVNYADGTSAFHNLDIYLPVVEKKTYPVVVYIYGSAWFSNNSKGADMNTIGKALLDAGFAVVMPNHRSSRDARFPAQVHDIKAVVRFLRGNAEKYRLDPSFIGISGSSSGGNLAAMAGATVNVKQKTLGNQTIDIEGELGENTSFSSSVDAVVAWFPPTNMLVMDSCGGTDFIHNDAKSPASLYIGGPIQENKELCLLASPTSYAGADNPPFLIFHGTSDRVVPYCQSIILHEALKSAGAVSELHLIEEGQHGPGVHIEKNIKMMVEFFEREAAKKTGWNTDESINNFLNNRCDSETNNLKDEKEYFGPNQLNNNSCLIAPYFSL